MAFYTKHDRHMAFPNQKDMFSEVIINLLEKMSAMAKHNTWRRNIQSSSDSFLQARSLSTLLVQK